MGCNIPGHRRARGDHRVLAQAMAANERRIRADRGASLDPCVDDLPIVVERPRYTIIGEGRGWADEDVVGDVGSRVDGHIVLDLHPITDFHAGIDVDVLTQHAAAADAGTGSDVTVMPDLRAVADRRTFLDDRCGMHEVGRARHGG